MTATISAATPSVRKSSHFAVTPTSTRSQCVEAILDLIVRREIPRETRTSEADILTALFGEEDPRPRTPVREALAVLAWQGFLHQVPQSGTYIHDVAAAEVRDLCDSRTEIECLVVRKLVATPEIDISRVASFADALGGALEPLDVDAFLVSDTDFHTRLATLAGYTPAAGTIRQWGDKLRVFASSPNIRRDDAAREAIGKQFRVICDQHDHLLQDLSTGDVDAACVTIGAHFRTLSELASITAAS